MKIHRCCESTPCGTGLDMPAARPSFAGRLLRLTGWLVPSTILVLMPKCPACLAAYVAIGTGLALTASTASYLRAALRDDVRRVAHLSRGPAHEPHY